MTLMVFLNWLFAGRAGSLPGAVEKSWVPVHDMDAEMHLRALERAVRDADRRAAVAQREADLAMESAIVLEEQNETLAADNEMLLRLARTARAVEVELETADSLPACKAAGALLRAHVDGVRGLLRAQGVEP